VPKYGDNFDKKYCEKIDKIGEDTQERYEKYIRDENYKIAFVNFSYNYEKIKKIQNYEKVKQHYKSRSIANEMNPPTPILKHSKTNSILLNPLNMKVIDSYKKNNTSEKNVSSSTRDSNPINKKYYLEKSESSSNVFSTKVRTPEVNKYYVKSIKHIPKQRSSSIISGMNNSLVDTFTKNQTRSSSNSAINRDVNMIRKFSGKNSQILNQISNKTIYKQSTNISTGSSTKSALKYVIK
jgi:hypothetical protein